jgi:large subunit ribosomal protein L20
MRSGNYAFRDRKVRKRDFRKLWIIRINAGARQHGMSYSQLMHGLKLAEIDVDRKILADLAVAEPKAFGALVEQAKKAIEKAAKSAAKSEQGEKREKAEPAAADA